MLYAAAVDVNVIDIQHMHDTYSNTAQERPQDFG